MQITTLATVLLLAVGLGAAVEHGECSNASRRAGVSPCNCLYWLTIACIMVVAPVVVYNYGVGNSPHN